MRHIFISLACLGAVSVSGCERFAATPPAEPAAAPAAGATPEALLPPLPLFDAAALGIPADPDSIADGRTIAETHCSNCHGLNGDASLRADAPPLRYILSQFPPETLAEDFRNGIHVGHEDMPDFVFGDLGMDVLLAYIVSIQEAPPAQ